MSLRWQWIQALSLALLAFVVSRTEAATEDIAIKTLPPDYTNFESADALLSDWEGEHWASLDADQDKVALSWTTTNEEAIFQVGSFILP